MTTNMNSPEPVRGGRAGSQPVSRTASSSSSSSSSSSITVQEDAAHRQHNHPRAQPTSKRSGDWLSGIPAVVFVLGAIALFTDMSSEMIMPLRLIFFVQVLGTPLTLAGLIEGIAEGGTSILKVISGRLADRFPSRRGLVIAGYGLSNLAKPLLALVTRWPVAMGLVLLDRAGKSVRGSPRDAMIVEAVAPDQRGKAFGFHRSADTLGAAFGPLFAILIISATNGSVRAVFAWTVVPGILAILVAVFFLRDMRAGARTGKRANASPSPAEAAQSVSTATETAGAGETRTAERTDVAGGVAPTGVAPPSARAWQGLGARFWLFTAIATCFALGNSSDAFLFLRTEGLESSLIAVPMVYFGFNMLYALLATPLGSLSDRFGRLPVLAAGYAAFTLVYLGWTQAHATWHVWALFGLYSIYYAATEGVGKAFVADLVPKARKGTALGWYNGLIGFAALPANIIGAWMWSSFGAGATFALGAWLGAISLGLLVAWWPWLRPNGLPWARARAPGAQPPSL